MVFEREQEQCHLQQSATQTWAWHGYGYSRAKRLERLVFPANGCSSLGMLRGFSWVLVGVLWGSQVLAGNLQGFLWDDHGAFKTPARPLQKAPLIHPMKLKSYPRPKLT